MFPAFATALARELGVALASWFELIRGTNERAAPRLKRMKRKLFSWCRSLVRDFFSLTFSFSPSFSLSPSRLSFELLSPVNRGSPLFEKPRSRFVFRFLLAERRINRRWHATYSELSREAVVNECFRWNAPFKMSSRRRVEFLFWELLSSNKRCKLFTRRFSFFLSR